MKKLFFSLSVLTSLFSSCKKENETVSKSNIDSIAVEKKMVLDTFRSPIRPNEKLTLGKLMNDEFEFVSYNDDGDYFLIYTKKNNKEISLIYDWKQTSKTEFNRGDIISLEWKMDSIRISGDGESLDFAERAIKVNRVKEGKLSLFKKSYTKELKYHYSEEYSSDFLNKIYELVLYYLANTKQELVLLHLKDPNGAIEYSIESQTKEGQDYEMIGLSTSVENPSEDNHSSIMQWLYIRQEDGKLFEYDLANDKLVPFE